ncbi:MAG: hypothetical protein JWM20_800 [Patescibacteria group bacterium]|nr:hypothetical protein [Patescibacteria group bacterium]
MNILLFAFCGLNIPWWSLIIAFFAIIIFFASINRNVEPASISDLSVLFKILRIDERRGLVTVGTTAGMDYWFAIGRCPIETEQELFFPIEQFPLSAIKINYWFMVTKVKKRIEFQRYDWNYIKSEWFKEGEPIYHLPVLITKEIPT